MREEYTIPALSPGEVPVGSMDSGQPWVINTKQPRKMPFGIIHRYYTPFLLGCQRDLQLQPASVGFSSRVKNLPVAANRSDEIFPSELCRFPRLHVAYLIFPLKVDSLASDIIQIIHGADKKNPAFKTSCSSTEVPESPEFVQRCKLAGLSSRCVTKPSEVHALSGRRVFYIWLRQGDGSSVEGSI